MFPVVLATSFIQRLKTADDSYSFPESIGIWGEAPNLPPSRPWRIRSGPFKHPPISDNLRSAPVMANTSHQGDLPHLQRKTEANLNWKSFDLQFKVGAPLCSMSMSMALSGWSLVDGSFLVWKVLPNGSTN